MNERKRNSGWRKAWRVVTAPWRWYAGLYRGKPWWRKLLTALVTFVLIVAAYFGALVVNLFGLFGGMPSSYDIMHPRTAEASIIYSADCKVIGKFYTENRTPVAYQEINPIFFKALIATEDERFYSHSGIDFQGVLAAVKDAFGGKPRGASTITQQLVKNMLRTRSYSTGYLGKIPGMKILVMKSKEWLLAVQIEAHYSKEEILTMYANTVDFGSNVFGIKTAAKTYFSTTPAELTPEQAAVLVGLLRATTYYNPRINPRNSLERRNVVLDNMAACGYITAAECEALKAKPLELRFAPESPIDGIAPYFRQVVAASLRDWSYATGHDLYRDGLRIYTTIDTRMQAMAEQAVTTQMRTLQAGFNSHWGGQEPWRDERGRLIPHFIEDIVLRSDTYKALEARFADQPDSVAYYLNKPHEVKLFDYDGGHTAVMSTVDSVRYMVRFLHAGLVAMEPQTGFVRAWVGDVDFNAWNYDKVTAQRQPGSTFKLFVYTTAMNYGYTPHDYMVDEPVTWSFSDNEGYHIWNPQNASGRCSGDSITLRAAFARSVNTVSVRLCQRFGPRNVANVARDMGIKSPLKGSPQISLGAEDVNLLELVDGYCTVVNNGRQHDPVLVTRIYDSKGNLLYSAKSADVGAIPPRSAFLMQQLLQAGMTETGGTSGALWQYVRPYSGDTDFGGKTGTSSNYSDAWFMAVTPRLVVGAWVGGEYRCIHFRSGALGQGSRTALPMCGLFLQQLLADRHFARYRCRFPAPPATIHEEEYKFDNYEPGHRPDSDTFPAIYDSLLLADPYYDEYFKQYEEPLPEQQ